jgi:hypothetical protein
MPSWVHPVDPRTKQASVRSDLLTPHIMGNPTLKEVNVPTGFSVGLGVPQHVTVPSIFKAHAKSPSTLTEVNGPPGAELLRYVLSPQQAIEPSALTAHAPLAPTLTEAKAPRGGVGASSPQQTMVPSVLRNCSKIDFLG